jgi:hypothetical protein
MFEKISEYIICASIEAVKADQSIEKVVADWVERLGLC